MSLVTVGKNGRVYRRRFDHDDAVVRYRRGESVASIARLYGVSDRAVRRVLFPRVRRRMDALARRQIELRRVPCRGGCGTLVYTHQANERRTGYCQRCLAEKAAESRPHGTENSYRYGCRCKLCREAASEAKRLRRLKTKMPCSHGCGRLVDTINRRYPDKPLECRPCSLARRKGQKTPVREAA